MQMQIKYEVFVYTNSDVNEDPHNRRPTIIMATVRRNLYDKAKNPLGFWGIFFPDHQIHSKNMN